MGKTLHLESSDMLSDEHSKQIVINGVKTNYRITKAGHVISMSYYRTGRPDYLEEFEDKDGYLHVIIYVNSRPKYIGVHRLVAMAYIPNPENKPEVNHKDGNTTNNDVSNLEWVTSLENIHHAWKNGLASAKSCENHPNSKYTNEQVHDVCKHLVDNKLSMQDISNTTGVSYTVVKQIKNHIIWNDVSKEYDFHHYNVRSNTKNRDIDLAHACELIDLGKQKISEIAEITNLSYDVVYNLYRKRTKQHN